MKQLLILFIVTMFSCVFCCTKQKTPETVIKVMTFNVRYGTAADGPNSWEHRQSILINCLKKHCPDIVGTQEPLAFQIASIKAAFPHWQSLGVGRYHNVPAPDRPFESMDGTSCVILYDSTKFRIVNEGTYWHSDTPDIAASKTWGNDLPRITTWGIFQNKRSGKQFMVLNTHLHWDEPYVSNAAHLIMRKWREIAGDIPAILTGDFNLDPTSQAHELFCGKTGAADVRGNFIDCWQALQKPETDVGTSHKFTGTKSNRRIDWILVTPEFKVNEIEIIYDNEHGRYPSDHFPVMAELKSDKI